MWQNLTGSLQVALLDILKESLEQLRRIQHVLKPQKRVL
jgi:hypothetical protein